MESALQTAKKSPASRTVKSGDKGLAMQKAGPMAAHIPKPKPASPHALAVGHRDDKYEREAITMADRVMSTGHVQSASPGAGITPGKTGPGAYAGVPAISKSALPEKEKEPVTPGSNFSRPAPGAASAMTGHVIQRKSQSQRMTVVPSSILEDDKRVQRKASGSGEHASGAGHASGGSGGDHRALPPSFHTALSSSLSGGHALDTQTASFMGHAFRADFKQVRVHTDASAIKMNQQLHAEAFTHKNHIYFNTGKYQPGSAAGKHLIAHELTHVVQQGYAGKGASTAQNVQAGWLSDIGDAISDAADFISDTIEAGIHKFLAVASEAIQKVPGYKALRVALGHDPITKEQVPFNGHNIIAAGLDLIPFGGAIANKLNELHAMKPAEDWIDSKISEAKAIFSQIAGSISAFISGISLSSLAHPVDLLEQAGRLIADGIAAVVSFLTQAAIELVNIIKKFLLAVLVDFIKNETTLYPLLTVVIGHDPITGEDVPRDGDHILTALILVAPDGKQMKDEMVADGSYQKGVKWINGAIAIFSGAYQEVVAGFHSIWDNASIEYLINPIDTFKKIYNTFAPPVARVAKFIIDAAWQLLVFIKDALKKKIATEARKHQGYPLLTVILGEDPFTGEQVPRNVENLVHGFMSLMDGGEEQFKQMKESGAIARAQAQVDAAVVALHFTKDYIVGLFTDLWHSFSMKDLFHPIDAFMRVVATLLAPIRRLIEFVIEIVKIAVHVILEIMQFPFDVVDSIMSKVAQAFAEIKKDPIGFLKNLLRAIKEGFTLFFGNIVRHLLDGLKAWLSSELKDAGVKAPADYTFKGILLWVLDTLNITLDNVWKKIEKKIGPEKVAKVKAMVGKLDGAWTFIKDVQERGLIAIWEKIQEKISNLWDMVLDFIKGWMMEKIIDKITAKLLSMLDPTGIMAVVNSTIAIYKAIQSAIQYFKRLLQIVNTFVTGILDIAKGNIKTAAGYLEDAMTQGVPVMIGFLANQVGLGGIGKKVGEMIDKVREKVDGAIQFIVDKAWAVGGPLLMKLIDFSIAIGDKVAGAWDKAKAMVKSGVQKVKDVGKGLIKGLLNKFSKGFQTKKGESHTLSIDMSAAKPALRIATTPQDYNVFLSELSTRVLKNPVDSAFFNQRKAKIAVDIAKAAQLMTEWKADTTGKTDHTAELNTLLGTISEDTKFLLTFEFVGATPGKLAFTLGAQNMGMAGDYSAGMKAYLQSDALPHGQPPTESMTANYAEINLRKSGKGSFYVKGHILSEKLGGAGTWQNLTPLSRTANSSHENNVEVNLKSMEIRHEEPGYFLYTVTPVYGRSENTKLLGDVAKKFPDPANAVRLNLEKVIKGERSVPTRLKTSVVQLDPATGTQDSNGYSHATDISNDISESSLDNYNV